ncbi:MAG: DinB family protein [Gemmatimonadetes bacterium]|nr:DinB family protein [Gemmatimonadota bacterium]
MHPQLALVADELRTATARARAVTDGLDEAAFHRRPEPTRWSVAECLVHLNLTTQAYLPKIDRAIREAQTGPRLPDARYRRDFMGWLLCWMVEPPARLRLRTSASFVPETTGSRESLIADFAQLQNELTHRLEAASGLDLNRLRITSPFEERMRYNLYSAFRAIPAHQRRHLWQAEGVRRTVAAPQKA